MEDGTSESKKEFGKITLPWVSKLRERLNDEVVIPGVGYTGKRYVDIPEVKLFLEPIIEYGYAEEKRITETFGKMLEEAETSGDDDEQQ